MTSREDPQSAPAAMVSEIGPDPAMPVVPKAELYSWPNLLVDSGIRHSLGWQAHRKAGPGFVVVRLTRFGRARVTDRFPLTEEGWANAWQTLTDLDSAAATVVARRLAGMAARREAASAFAGLHAESIRTLAYLKFSGGSGTTQLVSGNTYDVRFLSDRIMVCPSRSAKAAAELAYTEVEAAEVSATRSDRPAGEFTVLILVFGIVGALLGLFVFGVVGLIFGALICGLIGAAIGSASRTAETAIRIKGAGNEWYFAQIGTRADAVRIELSEPLLMIENARSAAAPAALDSTPPARPGPADVAPGSVPDQLTKLASLLREDLITRQEFEQLKADIIAGS